MRIFHRVAALCLLILPLLTAAKSPQLDFVVNGHQWPEAVRYKADLTGGAVFLTKTGFTYSYYSLQDLNRIHDRRHSGNAPAMSSEHEPVRCHAYTVTLAGCDSSAIAIGERKAPNYYNYFLGNDPAGWSGGMVAYGGVDYREIYPGIDLKVYSREAAMKYDFVVSPGADAAVIRLAFNGVTPTLTKEGDLLIRTSVNELREKAPYAYQVINGKTRQVPCRFSLRGAVVGFTFPNGFDRRYALVIDPVLVFATYSGSTSATFGWSATYDTKGNLYAGGESFGVGWPVTTGAFQTTYSGGIDVGINKYSANGSSLIYSTYYGGSATDLPNTMVVNNAGELVVAGATSSTNLPVSAGCYDNSFNGLTDVYVAHFNVAGTGLIGATYLGGSGNEGSVSTALGHAANSGEVLTDATGNIYVAFGTMSSNFPTTSGAFQTALNGTMDAFVTKMNGGCSNLVFSTLIGGSGKDAALAMQLKSSGEVVVAGGTTSTDFPATASGWQTALTSGTDGFIAILSSSGSALQGATYMGTSGTDNVHKIQLDGSGNVYAMGVNTSGAFPVSAGVYSVAGGRIFLAKIDPALGSRLLSTTISSSTVTLEPSAFLLDACGHLYFVGYGASGGLAVTSNAYRTVAGGFWMCVLDPNMAGLSYASYFGEIGDHIDGGSSRLDPMGIVYHSICTPSTIQPTTPGSWAPKNKTGGYDIASWKFDFQLVGMHADFSVRPKDTLCIPATFTFNNTSYGAQSQLWDFGDGSPASTLTTPPPHTYKSAGIYRISLHTFNPSSCVPLDSAFQTVVVHEPEYIKLAPPAPLTICAGDSARMRVRKNWTVSIAPNTFVRYQPGDSVIIFYPDSTTSYVVHASVTTPCNTSSDSIKFTIERDHKLVGHLEPFPDKFLCKGEVAIYQLSRKIDRFAVTPDSYCSVSGDSAVVKFYPPSDTKYKLISAIANSCTSVRDTFTFNVRRSTLKAAFALDPKLTDQNQSLLTLTNNSKNAVAYSWLLNHTSWTSEVNPSLTASDTGYYHFTLIATDANDCKDMAVDSAHVIETHIYMPSAFTPNGDDRNDVFRPIIHNADVLEFSIYNRYGERVFVTYDNRGGWNGAYHGEDCDLGTYFYCVRYRILMREGMLKGDVTLIR